MGYLTKVQVIERGNGTHQYYLILHTYPRRSVKILPYSCLLMPAELCHPSKGIKKY